MRIHAYSKSKFPKIYCVRLQFQMQGFKPYSVLPKAINIDSSSSDDEIPELKLNNSVRRFAAPKRNVTNTTTSIISNSGNNSPIISNSNSPINTFSFNQNSNTEVNRSKLSSQNFSTFSLDATRNLADTTIESLQQDSMRLLVNEATDKNRILKKQRDQLALELRQIKRENTKKIDEQRNRLEKLAMQLEKVTASCRNQKKQAEQALQEKLRQRNLNERYVAINEKQAHIDKTLQSFRDCSDTIENLSKILVYDVITENDFELLENTSVLDSPIGKCVEEFLAAAKLVIVDNQNK